MARHARVAPSTASEQLHLLVRHGVLSVRQTGRDRYYTLAGAAVADALEALARIAPPHPVRSLRQARLSDDLRRARTCYDHLAGALGVALFDMLVRREWLMESDASYGVTAAGRRGLSRFGVDLDDVARSRRQFARACLDWTERRFHLGGGLGAAVYSATLEKDWFRRTTDGRALSVTDAGRLALRRFGISQDGY